MNNVILPVLCERTSPTTLMICRDIWPDLSSPSLSNESGYYNYGNYEYLAVYFTSHIRLCI